MLGAAIALRRGEPMWLTTIVNGLAPRARAFVETLTGCIVVLFVGALLQPACEPFDDPWVATTPAME